MNNFFSDSSSETEANNHSVESTVFNLGYRAELDGFRGISILLVFIHHLYHPLLPGGFLGVDMFFVLSGFLITSLLLQEWHRHQNINLKKFFIRRLFRLMPAVIFLILILSVYAQSFLDETSANETFQGIQLTLYYVSNWFYAFDLASANNPLGVTWSLAVEEQFYLIFPVCLILSLKYKISCRQITYTLIFLVIVIALHRKFLADSGASIQRMYYASDTRADALLIGCLVAFFLAQCSTILKRFENYFKVGAVLSLSFLLLMFATASWSDRFLYSGGGYTFVALSVAALLIALVAYQPKILITILSFPPLAYVGRISYGLYLWHWVVIYFVYDNRTLPSSNLKLVSATTISFALTIFSFYFVEKPFLRLKNKFS